MSGFLTEWLQYGFMINALMAIVIITPLFGTLGTMIVERKMAFFSDALGHSAWTGIAVGVVLGCSDTNLSMLLFAVLFALLLNKLGSTGIAANDTVISVFSSCSIVKRRQFQPVCRASGRRCAEHIENRDFVSGSNFSIDAGFLGMLL